MSHPDTRRPLDVEVRIKLFMQDSGFYGIVWDIAGLSGGSKNAAQVALADAYKTLTRTVIRELDRIEREHLASAKPASKGKRALRKAKREGKLDVTPETDNDTPDLNDDDCDIIIVPDDKDNPPC